MLTKKVEKALNNQIAMEFEASNVYLSMASWAEVQGFAGSSNFLYQQSNEERAHAMRLFHYVNDRGGQAIVPAMQAQPTSYKAIQSVFEAVLKHEMKVSDAINNLVELAVKEKDFTTQNFLQWYVSEQIEEESQARAILDKLKLLGNCGPNLYLFDRDLEQIAATGAKTATAGE